MKKLEIKKQLSGDRGIPKFERKPFITMGMLYGIEL